MSDTIPTRERGGPSPGEQDREYPDGQPHAEQPRWRQDFPTDVPEDQALARREFTKFLVLTSGAFVAGQCWIGLMSLLQEGPLPEKRLAAESEVPVGGVVEFRYPTEEGPCLLVRLPGGRLVAYGQQCSHLSCAVIPEPEKGRLRCPCHNGFFEIEEGRPVAGPPRRPLPRIVLAVRDGAIYATGLELRTV
jgi:nitrite reductase/ring-hydroxylating ferredoxin subunit